MGADTFSDDVEPFAPETEPPEGALELALQEEAAGTEAITVPEPAPTRVGRTYALDLGVGRFVPEGGQPLSIYGTAAMRQAVEKALRTDRGGSQVQGDDYGLEGAERTAEGQPFDASEFADLEERIRDALLALPWVLDVAQFDAVGSLNSSEALVTFRVIPEGDDAEPIDFNRYPLPL